jgi:hypothetical protein
VLDPSTHDLLTPRRPPAAVSVARDAAELATSTTAEQLDFLLDQAELIMVAMLAAMAGTTLLHALLVMLWCKLPATRHRPIWKALLFPVPEVVITGLLALPIGLVATTLLVSPEASVTGKAMAGLGLGLLALFLALVYMVLAAVARRRRQLGLQYVDALEGRSRRWVAGWGGGWGGGQQQHADGLHAVFFLLAEVCSERCSARRLEP